MYGKRQAIETESGEPVIGCSASLKELFSKSFSLLNAFRKDGKYCDVNVIVDGTTFPCHRNVLASASTFFDNMFGGQFKESEEKEIQLKNLSAECFKNVLEFFYTKELKIDSSNSYELLEASVYFCDRDMENCCVEYMVSHFPEKHIVETCIYANSNSRKQLYEISLTYITKNWSQLCREDRLLEISPEILEDVVKRKSLIQVYDDVVNFIPRWKEKQNVDTNKMEKLLPKLEGDGTPTPCLFVHLLTYGKNSCCTVTELTYDKRSLKWKNERVFLKKESYEVNVAANGHLFTFYWYDEPHYTEFRVRKSLYDVHERLTKPTTFHLPDHPCAYSMAAIRDTIYFYDVVSSNSFFYRNDYELLTKAKNIEKSDRIYAYVYDLDNWFSVPKPEYGFSRSCMTSMNNQLYLFGGFEFMVGAKRYAQCYDHRSPNWTVLPEMSYAHADSTVCSYDEKLYVLGGFQDDCTFEVYHSKAGRWEVLQAYSEKRDTAARIVTYDDKLWVFPVDFGDFAKCYNPLTNLWIDAELWNDSVVDGNHDASDKSGNYVDSRKVSVHDAFVW